MLPLPTPPANPVAITAFTISGLDPANPPAAGAALGGNRNINFTIENAGNVNGNLTLSLAVGNAAAVDLFNDIDPEDADGVVAKNFPARAAVAGETYVIPIDMGRTMTAILLKIRRP